MPITSSQELTAKILIKEDKLIDGVFSLYLYGVSSVFVGECDINSIKTIILNNIDKCLFIFQIQE